MEEQEIVRQIEKLMPRIATALKKGNSIEIKRNREGIVALETTRKIIK